MLEQLILSLIADEVGAYFGGHSSHCWFSSNWSTQVYYMPM